MSKRTWIIFAVIVVVFLGALVISSRNADPKIDVSKVNPSNILAASKQSGNIADHVFGDGSSPVILTEYGDFQCPYCGEAYAPIKSVTTQFQAQIAFVFRNFPLTTLHPNALAAAAAVEAAGLQGKYWEYHDIIYTNQSTWENLTGDQRTSAFVGYASQLGLDTKKFKTDISSDAVNQKIAFDKALGAKLNIDATPSFYLDGQPLPSNVSQDVVQGNTASLIKLLNTTLTDKHIALPTATTAI